MHETELMHLHVLNYMHLHVLNYMHLHVSNYMKNAKKRFCHLQMRKTVLYYMMF